MYHGTGVREGARFLWADGGSLTGGGGTPPP